MSLSSDLQDMLSGMTSSISVTWVRLTDTNSGPIGTDTYIFDVPEGGSKRMYLTWSCEQFPSVINFHIRYRKRFRAASSSMCGEWGEWTQYSESKGGNGIANTTTFRSQHNFTFSSSEISPGGNDYAEMQVQVRAVNAYNNKEGEWSEAALFIVRLVPNVTFNFNMVGNEFRLGFASNWLRNGNEIHLLDIMEVYGNGSMAAVFLGSKWFGVIKDGYVAIPLSRFQRIPQDGINILARGSFYTCDGAKVTINAPFTVNYPQCNTPTLTLTPNSEDGSVSIVVADSGDRSTPIVRFEAGLTGGLDLDDLTGSLGQPITHITPPLDVDITYWVHAHAENGTMCSVRQTTRLKSHGSTFLNWGSGLSEHLALAANIEWSHKMEREKTYFKRATGFPAVFFGQSMSHEIPLSGDLIYPAGRKELESLANSTGDIVMRAPHGERQIVAVDSVDYSDSAANIQTDIQIQMTRIR